MKKFPLFLAFILLSACHKQAAQTQTASITSIPTSTISFFQIKISRNENIYTPTLISRQEVAGRLDKNINNSQLFENQWLISFLDNKKNILEQVAVPNPLDERFEVADDKGQLKSVDVKKKEAEFFFRVQSNPQFSSLEVEQILLDQKKKKLFSLNF